MEYLIVVIKLRREKLNLTQSLEYIKKGGNQNATKRPFNC